MQQNAQNGIFLTWVEGTLMVLNPKALCIPSLTPIVAKTATTKQAKTVSLPTPPFIFIIFYYYYFCQSI